MPADDSRLGKPVEVVVKVGKGDETHRLEGHFRFQDFINASKGCQPSFGRRCVKPKDVHQLGIHPGEYREILPGPGPRLAGPTFEGIDEAKYCTEEEYRQRGESRPTSVPEGPQEDEESGEDKDMDQCRQKQDCQYLGLANH